MPTPPISSYAEFWLFYLREHSRPATRAWHFFGTSVAALCLVVAVATRDAWWLAAMVLAGYAPAWIGHFASEGNRPATLRHPFWSLASDLRMYALWITGRLPAALEKAGIR